MQALQHRIQLESEVSTARNENSSKKRDTCIVSVFRLQFMTSSLLRVIAASERSERADSQVMTHNRSTYIII